MTIDTQTVEAEARQAALDEWKTKFDRLLNPAGETRAGHKADVERARERDRRRAQTEANALRAQRRREERQKAAQEARRAAADLASRTAPIRTQAASAAMTIEGCLICGVMQSENPPPPHRPHRDFGGAVGALCDGCDRMAWHADGYGEAVTTRLQEARPKLVEFIPTRMTLVKWWEWTFAYQVLTARLEGRRELKPSKTPFGWLTDRASTSVGDKREPSE